MEYINGNSAVVRGAVQAGCDFFAGYPITPATSILLELTRVLPSRGGVVIEAEDEIKPLGASSKVNAEWAFLRHLFEIGRRTADGWLAENYDNLGTRSTVDIRAMFQGK